MLESLEKNTVEKGLIRLANIYPVSNLQLECEKYGWTVIIEDGKVTSVIGI